jgi:signal transduction histidine kinase
MTRTLRSTVPPRAVPILTFRCSELESAAWTSRPARARRLERRCLRAFVGGVGEAIRSSDAVAHDQQQEDFVAALLSPGRGGAVSQLHAERQILTRLETAMERSGLEVKVVWTTVLAGEASIDLKREIYEAFARVTEEQRRFEFFAKIAHELRVPLAAIKGNVEAVLSDALDGAMARQYLEAANSEARRLSRLIDGMFEVSLLDLRATPMTTDHTDMNEAVSVSITSLAPMSSSAAVAVESKVFDDVCVRIGRDSLTQILVNLLTNAIQHGRQPGRVYITLAAMTVSAVELWIEDDGPGVRVEERERIFALGQRGKSCGHSGTGLGLSIVRRFLARVGGAVDVDASVYGGARFRVVLPRCAACRSRGGALAGEVHGD